MASGVSPSRGARRSRQVAVGEAGGQQGEGAADGEQGLDAGVGVAQAGDPGAGVGDDRLGEGGQGGEAGGGIVAEAFDVEQTPVGGVADLRQGGQVSQRFADPEVTRVS